MSLSRRRFIFISAAAIAMPKSASSRQPLVQWKSNAMGASARLAISGMSKSQAKAHIDNVRSEISRLENIFSLYRDDSILSRLNKDGFYYAPPLEFAQLLAQVATIHKATNGAFDPTIQPLWLAYAKSQGKPDTKTIERDRNQIGWNNVHFDANKIVFKKSQMAITLNGIAQGFITDRIADLLRAGGLKNVVVSVGEIVAMGERAPGEGWKIGISEKEDGAADEYLTLSDTAIATSAPLGTVLDSSSDIGHIIDPKTGTAPNHWKRISIIHPSAAIADGLSTAFATMTRTEIEAAISDFPGARLIAIDKAGLRFSIG